MPTLVAGNGAEADPWAWVRRPHCDPARHAPARAGHTGAIHRRTFRGRAGAPPDPPPRRAAPNPRSRAFPRDPSSTPARSRRAAPRTTSGRSPELPVRPALWKHRSYDSAASQRARRGCSCRVPRPAPSTRQGSPVLRCRAGSVIHRVGARSYPRARGLHGDVPRACTVPVVGRARDRARAVESAKGCRPPARSPRTTRAHPTPGTPVAACRCARGPSRRAAVPVVGRTRRRSCARRPTGSPRADAPRRRGASRGRAPRHAPPCWLAADPRPIASRCARGLLASTPSARPSGYASRTSTDKRLGCGVRGRTKPAHGSNTELQARTCPAIRGFPCAHGSPRVQV